MERYIAMPMGEPASIAPEMIIKALATPDHEEYGGVVVVGDLALFRKVSKDIRVPLAFTSYVENEAELISAQSKGELCIFYNYPCVTPGKFEYGVLTAEGGRACYECTKLAVSLVQNTYCSALVTPPMDSRSMTMAGYKTDRYESMIGLFASTGKGLDMLDVEGVKIFSLTGYMPLSEALASVTFEKILDSIIRIDSLTLDRFVFDPQLPIALCSLNPHRVDDAVWAKEDAEEVIPAAEAARKIGINLVGPLSADHVMHRARKGEYRAIIALYHDQASIAALSASYERCVKVTWELPFLRVSTYRGSMLELAGRNKVNPGNLIQALHIASAYIQIGVNS